MTARSRPVVRWFRRTPMIWTLLQDDAAHPATIRHRRVRPGRPFRSLESCNQRAAGRLESFQLEDVAAAERVIVKYSALEIGLADASIVVLSRRYGVRDLLTLDERHFRAIRGPGSRPFRILAADA